LAIITVIATFRDEADAWPVSILAGILRHQPRQVAGQLLGRLSRADGPAIGALLDSARSLADRPALGPPRRSLTPPGGPLLATLEGRGFWVMRWR
jgi:hypothetical protein